MIGRGWRTGLTLGLIWQTKGLCTRGGEANPKSLGCMQVEKWQVEIARTRETNNPLGPARTFLDFCGKDFGVADRCLLFWVD